MSKTFTSRPGVVRNQNTNDRNQTGAVPKTNRGRGRGTTISTRGTMATGMGRDTDMTGIGRGGAPQNLPDENPQQEQQLEQRMSYEGCYTKIAPNEKRRQEVRMQAEKESQQYQQYKEQRKMGALRHVGTAGGGEITESQARIRLVQENRNPGMKLREKREEYRLQQKKKEEDEINQKRIRQRELAEKNKNRQQQTDKDQRNKWDEDRRRKTDQFLSRFEGNTSQSRPQGRVMSEFSDPQNIPIASRSSDPQNIMSASRSSYPQNIPSVSRSSDPHNIPSASRVSNIPVTSDNDTLVDNTAAFENLHLVDDISNNVDTLHSIFPQYDRDVLQDILEQTHSVDAAIEMLQG